MPLIDYASSAPTSPAAAAIVESIRARRGGKLLNLDRMLLHSPYFARGWNGLLGAVRTELSLSARLRELAVCAVAVLNKAEYELQQHSPPFLQAGGTPEALAELERSRLAWQSSALFDTTDRAVLKLTELMTCEVQVPPTLLQQLRTLLGDDQQVVELVGVIATYNMVSRFLVALGIELEPT